MSPLSRRQLLRIGAGALTLPLWPRPARAGGRAPQRLLLVHIPQGTVMSQWLPMGGERDFSLPFISAPLERHRERMLFLSGIDNRMPLYNSVGNAHFNANYTFLTGRPFLEQVDSGLSAGGPSIEQVVAERIGAGAPFPRLDFTVGGSESSDGILALGEGSTMWHAPRDPVAFFNDPVAALLRIFGDQSLSPADAEALRQRRSSVLDGVLSQLSRTAARHSGDHRARLQAHQDRVWELQNRILAGVGSCTPPALDPPPGYRYGLDDPVTAELFGALIEAAFSCDLTRVATLSFANSHSPTFPWLTGANGGQPIVQPALWDNWHAMVHADFQPGMEVAFRWYHEVLAGLLDTLAAGTDIDGQNLLDTTLVVCLSEFSSGRHWNNALPVMLAGALGALEPGRWLDYMGGSAADFEASGGGLRSSATTNQLWTSLLQLFGGDDQTFGFTDADLPGGGLERL